MADFTKTLTNSIRAFGGSPSTRWGQVAPYTMTWGSTKWGEGTFTVIFEFGKTVQNTLSPSTDIIKEVNKIMTETLSMSQDMSSEALTNGIWRVVFVSDTTNVEERDVADWTSLSAGSVSFACLPAGSTSWN